MSLFKKRKHTPTNRTKAQSLSLDDLQNEEEASTPALAKKEGALVFSSNKAKNEKEAHVFESSASAMPAGRENQGATADCSDDYAGRISQLGNKPKAGPVKYSSNLRITCQFDYQPNVCKDYKETGYCGYGDSCKFLHDRSDYKSGWQLDREWDALKASKKREGPQEEDKGEFYIGSDEEPDDDLPFACFICKEPFTTPVVTRCKHYFCEECAFQHHKKDHRCAVCKEKTSGIFNVAHEIIKKQKLIQEKGLPQEIAPQPEEEEESESD